MVSHDVGGMVPGMDAVKAALKLQSEEMGFADFGVTTPSAIASAGTRLADWVEAGHHGQMTWMADRLAWRMDPAALWPQARSIVVLADNYGPAGDPMAFLDDPASAGISVYAQGWDYHDVVKKRLKRLGRWLIETAGGQIKVFVDTAPVMEKPLAAAAGLGWQGKHTNLVSRQHGSWTFLGAIFTTLDLPADASHADRCGSCRACLDVCPTAAFVAPYKLDASRCISYLNIELKGPVPRALRPLIGNRVYGCDDCLAICPWNKFAQVGSEAYKARPRRDAPALADLVDLDDQSFRALFSKSPIKRIGLARFLRNVLIAIGNSRDTSFLPAVHRRLGHPDPLVRGAAVWALSRLDPVGFAAAMRDDPDPFVAEEWRLGQMECQLSANA